MSKDFISEINKLNTEEVYPFHMPGHKRNMIFGADPYDIDITEIDGYDDLHHPTGMIEELQNNISTLVGADKSYVLVNGSTCGILAAISAVTNHGDSILMARNSHKSAYNAVGLRGLTADYLLPDYCEVYTELECCGLYGINGCVNAETVRAHLNNNPNKYKAIYITSPTYEGVVSDVKKIAEIAHEYNIPLIVDEAHGAHFGLDKRFPQSAISLGADIVIQSAHKTLPSMTQTAVAHVKEGYIDVRRFEYYLSVYQSSSPSYVLMASIDKAYTLMAESGEKLFDEYYKRLSTFREKCKVFKNIYLLDNVDKKLFYDFDCGKLIVFSRAHSGVEIYDYLRANKLQPEMVSKNYVVLMTSVMDTDEGFNRLYEVLKKIDEQVPVNDACVSKVSCAKQSSDVISKAVFGQHIPMAKMSIAKAMEAKSLVKSVSKGDISADYIYVYPPGIPMLVPGEEIDEEICRNIEEYIWAGFDIRGIDVSEENGQYYMRVTKE